MTYQPDPRAQADIEAQVVRESVTDRIIKRQAKQIGYLESAVRDLTNSAIKANDRLAALERRLVQMGAAVGYEVTDLEGAR